MTVRDSIEKIKNLRLQHRLHTKYEAQLNDNTVDPELILADIESWRKKQTALYFLLCFISLGLAPLIYAIWATFTKTKPISRKLTNKATEDIQEAIDELQKPMIIDDPSLTLEEKSEQVTQDKLIHSFKLLDPLKNAVERTLSSHTLSDNHIVLLQRLKSAATKTMTLRAFNRNNLIIPVDSIKLDGNFTYVAKTLTSVNENNAIIMGYSEDPGNENESPHFKVYFFLWNRLSKTASAHLIGTTRTTPDHSIYYKQISTQGSMVVARLGNKVLYYDINNSAISREIRLTEPEVSFYPASGNSIIEISENAREVFFIPEPASYQSKKPHINHPADSIEIPEVEKLCIFKLSDKTINFTTCTYKPELQKIYLGTNIGTIYEIDFDGANSPTDYSVIKNHNEYSQHAIIKIIVSVKHQILIAHLSNNTFKIMDTSQDYRIITPQSPDIIINSYENSGFNRSIYMPSFDQNSELCFVNEGQDMLYCNREITALLPNFATLFDDRNEHENSQAPQT